MLRIEKIVQLNGRSRYFIKCDEVIKEKEKVHSKLVEHSTEELFCQNTNIPGVYYFGCRQLIDRASHSAGYVWSSRAGCINGQFDTQLIEDIVINGTAYWSIDINVLKRLVEDFTGKQYIIQKYYPSYGNKEEEPNYRLIEKEN